MIITLEHPDGDRKFDVGETGWIRQGDRRIKVLFSPVSLKGRRELTWCVISLTDQEVQQNKKDIKLALKKMRFVGAEFLLKSFQKRSALPAWFHPGEKLRIAQHMVRLILTSNMGVKHGA
jgi:hypothetical protein